MPVLNGVLCKLWGMDIIMVISRAITNYKNTISKSALVGYHRTLYMITLMSFITTSIAGLYNFPRSIYLNQEGLSIKLYGLLISIACIMLFLLQIVMGKVSDRIKARKTIVEVSLLVNIAANIGLLFSNDIRIMSLCLILDQTATGICCNFYSIIVSSVTDKRKSGASFGFFKMAGSLSWAIFSVLSGVLLSFFTFKLLVTIVIFMNIAGFIITKFYVVEPPRINESVPTDGVRENTGKKRGGITVMLVCLFLLFMSINFQSSGGFSYLSIYLKEELHTNSMLSGWILAVSGLYEIPFTMLIGKLCDKYAKEIVIAIGCILGASRWVIISFIGDGRLMFLIQVLHAISICTVSVSFASYMSSIVKNNNRGTAFSIFYSIGSIGSISGPALVGLIGDNRGLPIAYNFIGTIGMACAAAYLVFYLINSKMRQNRKYEGVVRSE